MPWKKTAGGYTKKGQARGGFIRNTAQYEALKKQGMPKSQAAAISNASAAKGAKKRGKGAKGR
jgi:hypothetical protein